MDHPRPSRNPWRLPLLLLVSAVLVLSSAVHGTAACSTSTSTAIGTNDEAQQQQADSDNVVGGGDCHGKNHTHTNGQHGGGTDGKNKPGPPAPRATASGDNNPWVLSAGAAPPRAQVVVSGFTAATGVVILVIGAVVSWLATW